MSLMVVAHRCSQRALRMLVPLLWFSPALFSPAWVIAAPDGPAPAALQPATSLDTLLLTTGVFEQVTQLAERVDTELRNLEGSPLFTPEEIIQVRAQLTDLREDTLYQQLLTSIVQQFTVEELKTLQALSQRPELQFLVQEEQKLQSPSQQEYVRLYQLQTQEAQPSSVRVDWMLALDRARYKTQFETALKVALRKSVLASVAMVKTRQPLAETSLDQELSNYRQKLNEELRQQALTTYLYLFRKTPTDAVQATVQLFQDPLYQRLMTACEQALQQSFRMARARHEDAARFAQINEL